MRVALVLGSGGARGYAHIGVIRELEARGHEIVGVTGCSMGSVVGGMYAAGKLDEFEAWVRKVQWAQVLWYMDLALSGPGLMRIDRIMDVLAEIVGDVEIQDLPLPYLAVAVDIAAQREVWFTNGPLLTAIRASIAIPTAITPVVLNGRLLVDGGMLNPLPLEPAAMVRADAVVAVSLMGRADNPFRVTEVESTPTPTDRVPGVVNAMSEAVGGAIDGVVGFLDRFTGRHDHDAIAIIDDDGAPAAASQNHTRPGRSPEPLPKGLTRIDMMTMALNTMQASIEQIRTAVNPPDALISVPTDAASTFDFHRADEIIEIGRQLAVEKLDSAGL